LKTATIFSLPSVVDSVVDAAGQLRFGRPGGAENGVIDDSFNLQKAFDPRRTRSLTKKFDPYENRVDHRNGGSLDYSN
jgi:hypothetical protein